MRLSWSMLVGSSKKQVCQNVDTKAGLNLQEKFRGNACEQKCGGSWERLGETSEYNASLTPNERENEREGRKKWREGGRKEGKKKGREVGGNMLD